MRYSYIDGKINTFIKYQPLHNCRAAEGRLLGICASYEHVPSTRPEVPRIDPLTATFAYFIRIYVFIPPLTPKLYFRQPNRERSKYTMCLQHSRGRSLVTSQCHCQYLPPRPATAALSAINKLRNDLSCNTDVHYICTSILLYNNSPFCRDGKSIHIIIIKKCV